MRPFFSLGLAAAAGLAASTVPLQAQDAQSATTWELVGLRTAFCVQLLLDPASEVLRELPPGYQPVAASAATDLHVSLRSVVDAQTEFAAWSPSRLCFAAVDTIRTGEFTLRDRRGRHPQLLALWTVLASGPSGGPRQVALGLYASSGRLARSARLAGQVLHDARLTIGKVPAEDDNGVPSQDDRFQVKLDGLTITWDGGPARDSMAVSDSVGMSWAVRGARRDVAIGSLTLMPAYSHAMVGSLKLEGKNAFAKALRASPSRFAGPAYSGGTGTAVFTH
jgi:hypothetical protein